MISSIVQASGIILMSIGIGAIYWPLGIISLGAGVLLFGLALGKGK